MKRNWKKMGISLLLAVMLLVSAGSVFRAKAENDIVKLRVWGFGYTATSDDCARIAAAVSEITREKIGVEVELVRSSDGEKLNLALNSGEQWDLVIYHTYAGGLSTLVTNGIALPIDELAAQYAPETLELVGEDLLAFGKVNGELYSIPSLKDFASAYEEFYETI